MEGVAAKTGSVASTSSTVQESQERRGRARALARRFKLSDFGHRPQVAGPIRVSVWGGAPPTSRLAGVEFKSCDIASLLGKKLIDLYTFIIMQGAKI